MFKVNHRKCGAQVGWFLGDEITPHDMIQAETFEFMDGSHPKPCDLIRINCEHCGVTIAKNTELIRVE